MFFISFLKMTACPAGTFNEGRGFNCSGTSIYLFFVYLFYFLIDCQRGNIPPQNGAGNAKFTVRHALSWPPNKVFLTNYLPIKV